jgi:hypothetical protein
MYKELQDNDIVDLLAKTSSELAPSEASLSKLLSNLEQGATQSRGVAKTTPIQTARSTRTIPRNSPYMRFVSAFGGVVAICFIYFGVTGNTIPSTTPGTVTQNEAISTSAELASNVSIQATAKNMGARSTQAMVAKKAASSEVTELSALLETELAAEVSADTSLLALSDTL